MQGEELNNEPNANAVFKREGRTRATRSGNRIAKIGKVVKRKFVIIHPTHPDDKTGNERVFKLREGDECPL